MPKQKFPSKLFLLQLLLSNHVALLIGFLVSTGTLWKTLLYIIQYFYRGFFKKELSCLKGILIFVFNGLWIVVPIYFIVHYGLQLHNLASQNENCTLTF